MFVESEMKMIAKEECVEMFGKDLVFAHKDLCCPFYGYTDSGFRIISVWYRNGHKATRTYKHTDRRRNQDGILRHCHR